jgi:hypothetical protein
MSFFFPFFLISETWTHARHARNTQAAPETLNGKRVLP